MIELRLHDHAAYDHFTQCGMKCFEVEDQVELAHVLEETIQRLDEDLYEVEEGERRLGGRADDDEVEGRVVAVGYEGGGVVVGGTWGGGLGGAGEERREAGYC